MSCIGQLNLAKAQKQNILIPTPGSKAVSRDLGPRPVSAQSATIVTRLKAILAEEAGLDVGQMDSDVSFVEKGIISLLSITVFISRAQDELGLDMSSSTFADFSTLNEVVDQFGLSERESLDDSDGSIPSSEENEINLGDSTDASSVASEPEVMTTASAFIAKEDGIPIRELVALHMQRPSDFKAPRRILQGSYGAEPASSYSTLPTICPH